METLIARYEGKEVYIYYVNRDLTYVLASYTKDGLGLFKIFRVDLIVDDKDLRKFQSFMN